MHTMWNAENALAWGGLLAALAGALGGEFLGMDQDISWALLGAGTFSLGFLYGRA